MRVRDVYVAVKRLDIKITDIRRFSWPIEAPAIRNNSLVTFRERAGARATQRRNGLEFRGGMAWHIKDHTFTLLPAARREIRGRCDVA